MMRYTLYPSSRQYRQVVESLVGRHPFLRGVNGNGEDTLIASLCNKYRKDRQPLTHLDAVQAAKRKFGRVGGGRKPHQSDEDLEVTPKKGPCPSGDEATDPSLSSGDAQSHLAIEANRLNPNMEKVIDVLTEQPPK
ncbi:uncharacterized protein LOC135486778 [Lineus longissimus]|uniref:uncharacterized protein LOC135486778 n=1 Tax=Lineus longissimus TaxID=88925 RepID=UPI00315D48E9